MLEDGRLYFSKIKLKTGGIQTVDMEKAVVDDVMEDLADFVL
ncbi:hypothetical protein [Sporosarcina obsidiansis]|nr:hypothetical protein [Sporosarcina obsidiansis]